MKAVAPSVRTPTVVLMGNPNAGKTTIFNRLTGLAHKVANYPGVTVEKKEGQCTLPGMDGIKVRIIDLPGTYSLAAHSPDEMVAVDVLLGHQAGEGRPDLVLEIVDASNLERNFYLLSQVFELGIPVVVALNMADVAAARGWRIDAAALEARLGVPVVLLEGHRGVGFDALQEAMARGLKATLGAQSRPPNIGGAFVNDTLHACVAELHGKLSPAFAAAAGRPLHSFEVMRALIDRGGHAEGRLEKALGEEASRGLEAARATMDGWLALPALEAKVRYAWVRERVQGCLERERQQEAPSLSERLDRILTHKVGGLAIFGLLMLVVFQAIFAWAQPLMTAVERVFEAAGAAAGGLLPEGPVQSLIVVGVFAGVGMVVVFLPQILILFLFIGILEDCGYMARAAFLMDKIMSKCGLSGKSFIPMLSGFACAVPGIMATRVIEDRRDRLATILVTPLMSCSARLPVYSIFIGTFIPNRPIIPGLLGLQAVTLFSLYALGMGVAVAVAWVLRKSLLRGSKSPFVLELPSYKLPALRGLLFGLYERAKAFLERAGTTILAIAVVVWALAYFPHPAAIGEVHERERQRLLAELPLGPERQAALQALAERGAGAYLRQSYFGRLGRAVEPAFEPLGWDWRVSMAALASFPAREVIVSTLGTIYNLGKEEEESSVALRDSLRQARWDSTAGARGGEAVFTIPTALSVMVFFALCCQCGATVATIRRETNSWGWAWFAFAYMTLLAYAGGLITYQVGIRL